MSKSLPKFDFEAIGIIQSPFTQRFGIPRQPGLALEAKGIIKLNSHPDFQFALKGLEEFSHIWIIFVFHAHGGNKWKPTIRPPRLGGKKKKGVLSSRSPHRPNPIGISAVELERIDFNAKGGPEIHVKGIDLLDGTPVLDIKPYLPYADSLAHASSGWAAEPIEKTEVIIEPLAEKKFQEAKEKGYKDLRSLSLQLLEIDPRPGFQKRELPPELEESQGSVFGLLVGEHDIKWKIEDHKFVIFDLEHMGLKKKPKT